MDSLLLDLRFALRSLRRSPAFAFAAVLTLALGIGATAAIFSVVNGVLLRPAPFRDPGRLAMVWGTDRSSNTAREPSAIPDFADFQTRTQQFEQLAALTPREVNVTLASGDPTRVPSLGVSEGFFATVGLSPLVGRVFTADEDRAGGPRAVLIGEDLWDWLFQRDPAALGQTLRLDDMEWQVVGVLPRGSDFGTLQVLGAAAYQRGFADRGGRPRVDVWMPLRASPEASRDNHPIFVIGRLAAGATLAAAQAEFTQITSDLEAEYPQSNDARGAFVESLDAVVFGPIRTTLYVLVAAVALVLLVACTNVTNLLLARAAGRTREVTVRTALGASSGRLARQFGVEGAVLVGLGAVLGTAFAAGAVQALRVLAPATIPRAGELQLDAFALVCTAGVSLLIAFAFGLLPTLHARRLNLHSALQADGRGSAGSRRQRLVRSGLVVAQLAMATTLTVGASLLIRSLWTLQQVDPGFDASQVFKAEFALPVSRYPQDFARFPNWPERLRLEQEVRTRLSAQPGVQSVALAAANPMDAGSTSSIRVVGREEEAGSWPEPSVRTVSSSYLETLRVPLRAGRGFLDTDATDAPPVVLVNESAAARFFDGRDPLGAQINLWGFNRTVVGVIGNERFKGLSSDAPPAVYMPFPQFPSPSAVLVRMNGDAMAAAPLVRQVMREIDPELALFGLEPLEQTISGTLAERRFTMLVLALFALSALVLAAVGVHGVLSYTVAKRTREIGIRVALGADLAHVRRLVLSEGARLALVGVALGLFGAFALSRTMRSLLFGVQSWDPISFLGVSLLLGTVALVACWLPARRAARVDPLEAVRAD